MPNNFVCNLKKTNNETVLGIDCSSAVIGFGLISVEEKPQLLSYGYIKPLSSDVPLFTRLQNVHERITTLCKDMKPTHIALEDIFLFMKGNSTAKTITVLTSFNRVVGLAAFQQTGNITLYNVHEIRKIIKDYCDIKKPEKEELPDVVRQYLEPSFANILNRKNNVDKLTYDMSDGIAVAWAHSIVKGKR